MATQTAASSTNDDKVKFTTAAELESYAPMLEQEYVRKNNNPTDCVYKPVNMLPSFKGAVHEESVMQFYVVKFKASKGEQGKRVLQSIQDPTDQEQAFHIDCAKFVEGFKKA